MNSPPSTRKVVVSDAGPLICLGRLDPLGLLPHLFAEVQVPARVLQRRLVDPQRTDALRIAAAVANGVLVRCEAPMIDADNLQSGERSAIRRALEICAGLLVDDQAARRNALARGLDVIGTLGVLVLAKRRGLVPTARPLVDDLRTGGQRLSQSTVAEALAAAGEPS